MDEVKFDPRLAEIQLRQSPPPAFFAKRGKVGRSGLLRLSNVTLSPPHCEKHQLVLCGNGTPRRTAYWCVALLSMPFATPSAVEGIQIGQSAKSLRSSNKFHRLGTSKATWWARRFGVGPVCAFVTHDTVLANASERGRRLYWARALPMSGWRLNFLAIRSVRTRGE